MSYISQFERTTQFKILDVFINVYVFKESDILDSSDNDAEEDCNDDKLSSEENSQQVKETDSDNKNQIQIKHSLTEKEIFDKAAAEKELPYIFEGNFINPLTVGSYFSCLPCRQL